jgi:hypothetical protein
MIGKFVDSSIADITPLKNCAQKTIIMDLALSLIKDSLQL